MNSNVLSGAYPVVPSGAVESCYQARSQHASRWECYQLSVVNPSNQEHLEGSNSGLPVHNSLWVVRFCLPVEGS